MILFIAFLLLLPGTASPSVDSRETKRVLVLYSLERGNAGQDRMDARLREILGANKTFHVQIYSEYLDLVRFPALESTSVIIDYLARKYSREKPDVVITVLPPALKCIERNGSLFFKDIPLIAAFIP